MNDSTQPQQISEPLRKSDVPWYYSGIVTRIIAFGVPISMIYGMYVDTEFREFRPGILDGILSGLVGILLGWIAGRFSVYGFEQDLIKHKQGVRLWWLRGFRIHDAIPIALLIGTLACSALTFLGLNKLGLGWPLVNEKPTLISVFTFIGSTYYRFAKWYDNLPD